MTLTSGAILTLVSALLAIVFEYLPVLHEKYNALNDNTQSLIMIALIVLAFGVVWYGQCNLDTACYSANWQTAVVALFGALATNQTTHRALPKQAKSTPAA